MSNTRRVWSYEGMLEEARHLDRILDEHLRLRTGAEVSYNITCGEDRGHKYWDITFTQN